MWSGGVPSARWGQEWGAGKSPYGSLRRDAQERLFLGEGALLDHVDGDLDGGLRRSLPVSALEHVHPSVLHRELDVLGIIGIITITSS